MRTLPNLSVRHLTTALLPLMLLLGACSGRTTTVIATPAPTVNPVPVSIEVEVFDPATGFIWENVGVRTVEAYQEWADASFLNPIPDDFYFTDSFGTVFFDEFLLGDQNLGFQEDFDGAALLYPGATEDQAVVTLEVWAPGFTPVFVDVELTWFQGDVFISVPFN